jgi:hypothetical protein
MSAIAEYWVLQETAFNAISGSAMASLASNSLVLGSAISNLQGAGTGTGNGNTLCRVTLKYQFASTPTAWTGFSIWLLKDIDGTGTTFEDGGSSYVPTRPPDIIFTVGPSPDTSAHVVNLDIEMPAGYFKALLLNNGTGQALVSTTSVLGLSILPITYEGL